MSSGAPAPLPSIGLVLAAPISPPPGGSSGAPWPLPHLALGATGVSGGSFAITMTSGFELAVTLGLSAAFTFDNNEFSVAAPLDLPALTATLGISAGAFEFSDGVFSLAVTQGPSLSAALALSAEFSMSTSTTSFVAETVYVPVEETILNVPA